MRDVTLVHQTPRLFVGLLSITFALSAHAQLIAGDLVVYDEDRDITWIREADSGQNQMTFSQAQAFAAGFGGLDGTNWRLPNTPLTPDNGCTFPFNEGDNCIDSELGHLYYTELGNSAGSPAGGPGLQSRGPFIDLNASVYWSGTQRANGDVIIFNFFNGFQTDQNPGSMAYVWLVHDGKLAGVPTYFWRWFPLLGWIIVILVLIALPVTYFRDKLFARPRRPFDE